MQENCNYTSTNTFKRPWNATLAYDPTKGIEEEFHIILIGDRNVGKTSLVFKSATKMYSDLYIPTNIVDFRQILVETHQGKKVLLKLWDTPGYKPKNEKPLKEFFSCASAFLVIYDVTSIESYNNVYEWMKLIKRYSCDQSQLVVIGNKTDLTNERKLTKEDGMNLAACYGAKFMEINIPHNRNIQKTFKRLATNLIKTM